MPSGPTPTKTRHRVTDELPVHRLGWRDQTDQSQDRDLRRSDAPLTGKDLDESGLAQFPTVMGGIVPVVNLEGVKPGELVIDGPTLAKIFLGEITKWDDACDQEAESGRQVANPGDRHRAPLGRTRAPRINFAYYLAEVSADWKSKVGVNTALQWPAGIGAKGNEGVANNVGQTKGSIGYVEYAYAKQNKLTFTKMVNKDGKTVAPTSEAFQAAAANADWKSQPGYGVILANQPGDSSWPMTAATWILVYKQPRTPLPPAEALKFFAWGYARAARWPKHSTTCPCPRTSSRMSRRPGRMRSRTRAASPFLQ